MTERVAAAIEKYFSVEDRADVAALLEGQNERIQLAILRLSRREAARVRSLVEAARRDYRDVLMWESEPTRVYIVGLLRSGPNAGPEGRITLQFASLRKWKDAGAIAVGGLFLDETGARGLYIFTVDSVEAAQALVSQDPGVQSGKLVFEFHRWMSADGLQVGVPRDFLDV